MELFLYGNPRLLSGSGGCLSDSRASRRSYESKPSTVNVHGMHTTASLESALHLEPALHGADDSLARAKSVGESIHSGKGGYHETPRYNKFLVEGQWPSAGIELETISTAFSNEHATALENDLKSNWFHFERDGSLDNDHGGSYGYELITEPLPPRVYRDPETWVALENLVSPWLESFDHSDTGLHVHVGLNQFMDFDSIPVCRTGRMYIGKAMSVLAYYAIVDPSFIDRVVLRRNTRYCAAPLTDNVFDGASMLANGSMNGYEFIDMAVKCTIQSAVSGWRSNIGYVSDSVSGFSSTTRYEASEDLVHPLDARFCTNQLTGTMSHSAEINADHLYTIEFRRPKGTIHALSVHRIVELMTLIVRYAGKCCREPEVPVSSKAFYAFAHDNTTSAALKSLIEKTVKI